MLTSAQSHRWLIPILLLAFTLRIYALDFHPLWVDEGITLYFAPRTLAENARVTSELGDVSPPLYRRAIGYWGLVAGFSPFAVRYVSVLSGLLAVALTWAAGRRLVGTHAALIGTLICAVAPDQIQYAQEAKGYAFQQVGLLLASVAWLHRAHVGAPLASPPPTRRATLTGWATYAVGATIALATHYTAVLVLGTHGLWTLIHLWRTRTTRPLGFALGHALALACAVAVLVPWVLLTASGSQARLTATSTPRAGVQSLSALDYLISTTREFAAGPYGAQQAYGLQIIAALIPLVCLGALFAVTEQRDLYLPLWATAPVAAGFIFQLRFAFFYPRFMLAVTPAWYLLAGLLLTMLWVKWERLAQTAPDLVPEYAHLRAYTLSGLVLLVLLGVTSFTLLAYYRAPIIAGDEGRDWRPLFTRIAPSVRTGDAVISSYLWGEGYFRGYLRDVQPDFYLGFYSPENVDAALTPFATRAQTVWLMNYGTTADDPGNLAAAWLNARAARVAVFDDPVGNFALYAWPPTASAPTHSATFSETLSVSITAPADTGATRVYALTWETRAPLDRDLHIYLHVLAPDGTLLAGTDSAPVNGLAPTYTWTPGTPVYEARGVLTPNTAPAGTRVVLGVYDAESGARWPVTRGAPPGATELPLTP